MSGAVQKASVSGGARIEMAKAISVQSMAGKGPAGFRLGAELKDYAALRERLQEVLNLEKDLGIDHTELQRYAQFARASPVVGGRRQLSFPIRVLQEGL